MNETENRCSSKKGDGTLCKRRVAEGERHCWQHARWPQKFRSLTSKQRVVGVLGVVGVVLTAISLVLGIPGYVNDWAAWFQPKADPGSGTTVGFKNTALAFITKAGSPFVPNEPVTVRVVYENKGFAEAKDVIANGALQLIPSTGNRMQLEEDRWKVFYSNWLSSLQGHLAKDLKGRDTASFDLRTSSLSQEQAFALRRGEVVLYFMGSVKWTDATGQYATDLCSYFCVHKHGNANTPAVWCDCLSGHSRIRYPIQPQSATAPSFQRANVLITDLKFLPPKKEGYPEPLKPGSPVFVEVSFMNGGPIAARNVVIFTRLRVVSTSDERAEQERTFREVRVRADRDVMGTNSIQAGRGGFITVQYPLAMFNETHIGQTEINGIRNGTKQIILVLIARYEDDFGSRETHFCQAYVGTSWSIWTDCHAHNELVP